ncbi:XdhC family protein [Dankookia sp. P2]|uniref:XdhC family protein n=1 Tax=Dankookia sp. P2 TaxID=3423955 RepID=UPI003D673E2F
MLATAAGWRAAGETVALATVVETWGSSPRPAGSRLAVSASGKLAGSVSGGCIEGRWPMWRSRPCRPARRSCWISEFSDERAWEVGLACGGKLKVFVEKLS